METVHRGRLGQERVDKDSAQTWGGVVGPLGHGARTRAWVGHRQDHWTTWPLGGAKGRARPQV